MIGPRAKILELTIDDVVTLEVDSAVGIAHGCYVVGEIAQPEHHVKLGGAAQGSMASFNSEGMIHQPQLYEMAAVTTWDSASPSLPRYAHLPPYRTCKCGAG